ncbi:hypothetical protein KDX16_16650 [Burkholderia vietnamiensis]|jgi:hypothetical protein|uniref:Fis family transcriptional regulator n=1 Tax=Burkholderia contaminans TaxID=488447 RepID=A0AAP4VMI9_9BURK|nr:MULTISPECIES: hypothetical protein [Burkholderia]HDR9756577.1 hypothetical protein [Burkholderia cepacia ATCC 25416]MBR7917417.1 hypothetical protein [Burkholderia vietnamiensis]MBR8054275.1 hypothetical protein [Burkholderia vietnamiensis]MDN7458449.1 hypothetical protein [Burkholderia cenocepacia]MDN7569924.1 hypothetical protein [Burkholderia contaminans]
MFSYRNYQRHPALCGRLTTLMKKRGIGRKRTAPKASRALAPIIGSFPMSQERISIATAWHIALDQIKRGTGRRTEVEMVADALNLALILCERGHFPHLIEIVKEAQEAFVGWLDSGPRRGNWRMSGEPLAASCTAIAVLDAQIATAPTEDILLSQQEIQRRIMQGDVHSGHDKKMQQAA